MSWSPTAGINALLGPGDTGKSTVLEAIDLCLGARRTITFTDVDFHGLDESQAIRIAVTLGDLPDALLDIDTYGVYLRAFDPATHQVIDEPDNDLETVITIVLTVDHSLEPIWTLYSDRATEQRGLSWRHRSSIAPSRLGPAAGYHFAWRHGSLLTRLTNDLPDASSALAAAAREARRAFGEQCAPEIRSTLELIAAEARSLGISVGTGVKAMLDADSVAFGRGTIALHTSDGVPLQCLGTGSLRLLAAGMQHAIAGGSAILLVDEIEHGLEPYRVCRLLDLLGAKEAVPTAQVFLTTHSPVVIRELPGDSLFVLRQLANGDHSCIQLGTGDDVQGTARTYPEAFLARSVIVCEGASEVGMLRGLDQYEDDCDRVPLAASGIVFIDGGGHDRVARRAAALQARGFSTAILRDSDRADMPAGEAAFISSGGVVFSWQAGRALEDELFGELPENAVHELLDCAIERVGEPSVNDQIQSKSEGRLDLATCRSTLTPEARRVLGLAARSRQGPWFKSVSAMEAVGRKVVGPRLGEIGGTLRRTLDDLRDWAHSHVA